MEKQAARFNDLVSPETKAASSQGRTHFIYEYIGPIVKILRFSPYPSPIRIYVYEGNNLLKFVKQYRPVFSYA